MTTLSAVGQRAPLSPFHLEVNSQGGFSGALTIRLPVGGEFTVKMPIRLTTFLVALAIAYETDLRAGIQHNRGCRTRERLKRIYAKLPPSQYPNGPENIGGYKSLVVRRVEDMFHELADELPDGIVVPSVVENPGRNQGYRLMGHMTVNGFDIEPYIGQ